MRKARPLRVEPRLCREVSSWEVLDARIESQLRRCNFCLACYRAGFGAAVQRQNGYESRLAAPEHPPGLR
jgi:hypothetical protein